MPLAGMTSVHMWRSALGVIWAILAVMKAADPDVSRTLSYFLPGDSAWATAVVVCVGEFVLGVSLFLGAPLVQRVAAVASLCLLIVYGVYALVGEQEICGCAGRLGPMTPVQHSALIAAMLVLSVWSVGKLREEGQDV